MVLSNYKNANNYDIHNIVRRYNIYIKIEVIRNSKELAEVINI